MSKSSRAGAIPRFLAARQAGSPPQLPTGMPLMQQRGLVAPPQPQPQQRVPPQQDARRAMLMAAMLRRR